MKTSMEVKLILSDIQQIQSFVDGYEAYTLSTLYNNCYRNHPEKFEVNKKAFRLL